MYERLFADKISNLRKFKDVYIFCRHDIGLDPKISFAIANSGCPSCLEYARISFGLDDSHFALAKVIAKSFQGKKGDRFDNCVKHFMGQKDFNPKKGRSKEESAQALCHYLAVRNKVENNYESFFRKSEHFI